MRITASAQELEHPHRRRILRTLQASDGQLTAAELRAAGCVPCSASCLNYHLGVLVAAGFVHRLAVGNFEGRVEYAFAAVRGRRPAPLET